RYPITHKHRNRFNCKEDRVAYIEDFVYAYNRTRLKCIGYKAPLKHLCNHAKQYTSGRGRSNATSAFGFTQPAPTVLTPTETQYPLAV
ncbi:MAG: hypothetical protein ACKO34_01775, partial [Vampirovibrionales bacterium]